MARHRIAITEQSRNSYSVTIDEQGSQTTHLVTVWPSDVERYAPGSTPEDLIEASFAFLLEREPKESILGTFELPIIERYFPEYRQRIGGMVEQLREPGE